MRLLPPPTTNQNSIFDSCRSSVADASLATKLDELRPHVDAISTHYIGHAAANLLHTFPPAEHGDPEQIISLRLSKGDLVRLYEAHMVAKYPGRDHYDKLLVSSPLSKCPYCGFGQVSTLDHFASKSRYPLYSIEARNLVPACADCNKLLGSSPITEDSRIPHPYFGDPRIEHDTWLYATVLTTSPATVNYLVIPPTHWDAQLQRSVNNYFNDLELDRRFAIEGNAAIVEISDSLKLVANPGDRALHLSSIAQSESARRTNSWRAALTRALAASAWYANDGYLQ